ncbi:MAG: hypothetical protein KAS73_01130 [Candidatus Sabulitectum sp.]|nr:hypothetical protein [Candidatus Sabulitectum sp.]
MRMFKVLLLPVIVFLFLSGCKPSIKTDTWIITTGNDTVFVGGLGETWAQLDSTRKMHFLVEEDTAEEFIIAYGRKLVLERELQAEGFLSDPLNLFERDSWFMYRVAALARQMQISREIEAVSEDDIAYYRRFLGKNVTFTVNPGSGSGSESIIAHLPDLPPQLGMHLDTLDAGQTAVDGTGLEVRLDHVTFIDSVLIKHALEDSSTAAEMAMEGLSEARYELWAKNKVRDLYREYSVTIDYPGVDTLSLSLLGIEDIQGSRIIVYSDFRNWTVDDLQQQLIFLSTRTSIQPDSPVWLLGMIDNLLLRNYFLEVMQKEHSEILDSLAGEADRFLLETVSNYYYTENINSDITLTDDNIRYEYENLQEPYMIQEKRSLQIAIIPEERMVDFEGAVNGDQLDEFTSGLESIPYLSADPSEPQITYPLGFTQVPGGHGLEIFQLSSADTIEWYGPFDTFANSDMVLIKLIEIFPERVATLDESREDLRTLAIQRQEEQAVIALLLQLEEKYELTINTEILNLLPDDPGLWNQL